MSVTIPLSLDRIGEGYQFLDDWERTEEQLRADEARLFCNNNLRVALWPSLNGQDLELVTNKATLNANLVLALQAVHSFLILKQEFTFGRLLISLEEFQHIMNIYQTFPPLANSIRAFGPDGSGLQYTRYHRMRFEKVTEICYNIHYPELHGRSSHPPWSIRHMSAYQHYTSDTKCSRWLFVQPSDAVERRLKTISNAGWVLETNPALPHLVMFQSAETGWEPCLKYWQKEYSSIEKIARYSKVGTTEPDRFKASFKHAQRLEYIRHEVSSLGEASELRDATRTKFNTCIHRLQAHARTADLILQQSRDTASLLSHILNFRNDETIIAYNRNTRDMMSVLTELGNISKDESASLKSLSEQSQKDSRFTKILTFVAMLYLPASLVATIFSSDLVQSVNVGDSVVKTKMAPVSQFWVFPVSTVVLTIITMTVVIFVDRFQAGR